HASQPASALRMHPRKMLDPSSEDVSSAAPHVRRPERNRPHLYRLQTLHGGAGARNLRRTTGRGADGAPCQRTGSLPHLAPCALAGLLSSVSHVLVALGEGGERLHDRAQT